MRISFFTLLVTCIVCSFSSEQETNEKSSQSGRLSQNFWPHHYKLKPSAQMKLDGSSFWDGTMINTFSQKVTNTIPVNFSLLKIHSDDIAIMEVTGNRRKCCLSINLSKTSADDENQLLTIIVEKQLTSFGTYEVYIPFEMYLNPILIWFYQCNSFDMKPQLPYWLPGNYTDPVNSQCTFSSLFCLAEKFLNNLDWILNCFIHTELISPKLPPLEIPTDLWSKNDDSDKSNFSTKSVFEAPICCTNHLNFPITKKEIDAAIVPAAAKVKPIKTAQAYTRSKKLNLVTLLQINVNHSSSSQQLAIETAKKIKAKLIIISEPYLVKGKLPSTPGWLQVYADTAAILIDETLSYSTVTVNSSNTVAIQIEDILIISTYASPNARVEEEFLTLQNLLDKEYRVIVAGDFNCRHPEYTEKKLRERDYFFQQLIKNHKLVIANNNIPTLEHRHRLSINDYTLCKRVQVTNWRVLEELESLSDHRYMAYKINFRRSGRRVEREVDEDTVEELLKTEQLHIDELENRQSTNEFATTLTHFLSNLTETGTVERAIIPKSLYWNDELEAVENTLIYLRKKLKQTGLSVFKKLIKVLKRDFREMTREAKREAWRKFEIQNTIWGQPPKIKFKNFKRTSQLISDETLLLEKIGKKLPSTVLPQVENFVEINEDVEVAYVTEAEVTKVLKSMSNRTAPGPDGINFKVLKMFHKKHPTILAQLFSACLRFRLFPDIWKKGKVIWFSKPNKDPNSIDSYRPITLLSCLGNVFEKCIGNRIKEHIQENNILSPRQFGFVAQKNKESCIRSLLTEIREFRHNYNFVALVKIDIEAAFDSLSWNHMMSQLRRYKFPTYLVDLVDNYIKNRLVTSGTASIILEKGGPQGSVLGPLLWNLSYNYLLEHFSQKGLSVFCYADDTAFVLGAESQQNLIEKIRSTILETVKLISPAGLKLSLPKTGVMVLNGNVHIEEEPELLEFDLADKQIKTLKFVKYLGVTIDNMLN